MLLWCALITNPELVCLSVCLFVHLSLCLCVKDLKYYQSWLCKASRVYDLFKDWSLVSWITIWRRVKKNSPNIASEWASAHSCNWLCTVWSSGQVWFSELIWASAEHRSLVQLYRKLQNLRTLPGHPSNHYPYPLSRGSHYVQSQDYKLQALCAFSLYTVEIQLYSRCPLLLLSFSVALSHIFMLLHVAIVLRDYRVVLKGLE